MKVRTLAAMGIVVFTIYGCGKGVSNFLPDDSAGESRIHVNEFDEEVTPIIGSATFGSQCPHGFYASPQPASIELATKQHVELLQFELRQSLDPLVVQADCVKKTLDLRGLDRAGISTTWEFPPDGNFFIRVSGGMAQFKDDGAGNLNCSAPTVVAIEGKVDCQNPDFPIITLNRVNWDLSKTLADFEPRPNPSGIPSPSPSTSPSGFPTLAPSPRPSLSPGPRPTPRPAMTPSPRPRSSSLPGSVGASPTPLNYTPCAFPNGAYIQIPGAVKINQCS